MIDDIFSAQFHFEDPSGASSTRCFFQQTADNSSTVLDAQKLAESLEDELDGLIIAMLSNSFSFSGITVRKHYEDPAPKALETGNPQQGVASGPGLPSNCCINFQLNQSSLSPKSNGRMFWPGIPEPESNVGVLETAYQSGPCIALASRLVLPFNAIGDTGVYNLGVISQNVLNFVATWSVGLSIGIGDQIRNALGNLFTATSAGTTAGNDSDLGGGSDTGVSWVLATEITDKDWPGAFSFVTSVGVNPIIAIQRRRTTKVVGAIG